MKHLLNIGKNNMKYSIPFFIIPAFMILSGCWISSTKESPQGGVMAVREEFSITVPKSYTVKQGSGITAIITLNRDAYFKQNVELDMKANGIDVSPTNILIKASDKPETQIKIVVPREAALGNYILTIKGTPETGHSTFSELTITVIPQ